MPRRLLFALSAAALTLLIGLAAWTLGQDSRRPPAQVSGPPAPAFGTIPLDAQQLAAGQSLYVEHCLFCHGADGRGDAAYAAQMGVQLPDLPLLMAPGVRSDEQVATAIKNGVSGSPMPGFGLVLNDQQLAQIVAYMRALGLPGVVVLPTLNLPPGLPAATPPPDVAEPLPPLVFVRQGALYASSGDGSAAQELVRLEGLSFATDPALAPDGSRIAFVTLNLPSGGAGDATWSVQLADRAGGGLREIGKPSLERLSLPAWAPDGTALYLARSGVQTLPNNGGEVPRNEILRLDLLSGVSEVVQTDATSPAVSPDGALLAFVQFDPQRYTSALQVAPLSGGPARTLVDGAEFGVITAPRFAPDSTRIVFSASGGPTASGSDAQRPASPSVGGRLATALASLVAPPVARAHGDPQDIWVVGVDGGGLRRLTQIYEDEPRATFSPDGREIVLMGFSGIYRMNADGSSLRRIDRLGDHGGLDWPR